MSPLDLAFAALGTAGCAVGIVACRGWRVAFQDAARWRVRHRAARFEADRLRAAHDGLLERKATAKAERDAAASRAALKGWATKRAPMLAKAAELQRNVDERAVA